MLKILPRQRFFSIILISIVSLVVISSIIIVIFIVKKKNSAAESNRDNNDSNKQLTIEPTEPIDPIKSTESIEPTDIIPSISDYFYSKRTINYLNLMNSLEKEDKIASHWKFEKYSNNQLPFQF